MHSVACDQFLDLRLGQLNTEGSHAGAELEKRGKREKSSDPIAVKARV